MDGRSPIGRALRAGVVALVFLPLLDGCVDTAGPADTPPGPDLGVPVDDYETFVFDLGPSSDPVIAGGIAVGGGTDEQDYVTLITNATETDRFDRSLLPADAGEFVVAVAFENESLVVIQAYPAASVSDRVESVARDGPTLHVAIDDSRAGRTDDVTVATVLVRLPGEMPDNVIVSTEAGRTFEVGGDS